MDEPITEPMPEEAAALVTRLKRLMMVTLGATFLALAAVLMFIGYRVFSGGGSAPAPVEAVLQLPRGAKVLSSAVAEGRIVVTVEIGGAAEILSFDQRTLQPLGRVRLGQ